MRRSLACLEIDQGLLNVLLPSNPHTQSFAPPQHQPAALGGHLAALEQTAEPVVHLAGLQFPQVVAPWRGWHLALLPQPQAFFSACGVLSVAALPSSGYVSLQLLARRKEKIAMRWGRQLIWAGAYLTVPTDEYHISDLSTESRTSPGIFQPAESVLPPQLSIMEGETQARQAAAAAATQRQPPAVSHVSLTTPNPEREALVKLIHSQIMDFHVNHPPTLEKAVGIWLKVSIAQFKRHRLSMLQVTAICISLQLCNILATHI